jgi:hypothetical protein
MVPSWSEGETGLQATTRAVAEAPEATALSLPQTYAPRPRGAAAREATTASSSLAPTRSAEMMRILDDLVDAIDVREAYEPGVSGWDTAHTIRRLERELARAWTAMPSSFDASPGALRWQP